MISFLGNVQIGSRFILFAVFFLHLGIALYLKETGAFSIGGLTDSLKTNGELLILLFALLIIPGVFRTSGMAGLVSGEISPVTPYLFLSKHLSPDDVVLASDWREGYPLPAITGCRIVEPRHSFTLLIGDESVQRKKDAAAFFRDSLTSEERLELLRKYGATYILIDLKDEPGWHPSFRESLVVLALETAREKDVILYRIKRPTG